MSVQHLTVSYAPNNNSLCRKCLTNIAKSVLRVGLAQTNEQLQFQEKFMHFFCFDEIPSDIQHHTVENVQGFHLLAVPDQTKFTQRFNEIKSFIEYEDKKVLKLKQPPEIKELEIGPSKKQKPNNTRQLSGSREKSQEVLEDKYAQIFELFRKNLNSLDRQKLNPTKPIKKSATTVLVDKFEQPKETDLIEFNE